MLISSIIFSFGFFWRLWSNYSSCQWCTWCKKVELWNCALIVTKCVQCAYCTKSDKKGVKPIANLWSSSYSLFCRYPLCCHLPLCIHGNSCLLGSTTGNQQCLNILTSDHYHCGKHTSISVVCWPMRVGIQVVLYPCCTGVRIVKRGLHPFLLLLAEWQDSVMYRIFKSVSLFMITVFDYYLYGYWNHIDTSQLNKIL